MPRFRYNAKHDILKYPKGRILRPTRPIKHGRFFYSKSKDCGRYPLRGDCLSKGRVNKAVVVGHDYPALLRARRRRERWTNEDRHGGRAAAAVTGLVSCRRSATRWRWFRRST